MTAAFAHRPTIAVTRHAIAAGHYLAATAGFAILEAGGNAIDAGCAAGLALGVLQSDLVDVAGVAPIMIYLAEISGGRHHRRARDLAQGARPRILYARAWRQDPEGRAAHRRPGRPRRLDHRAQALRHDELWRGRGGGDPARPRGLSDVPADGGEPAAPRTRPPRLAVLGGNLSAQRPRARSRRHLPPDRSRRLVAIHGRRGAGRRPAQRRAARPACRPRTTRSTAATSPKRSSPLCRTRAGCLSAEDLANYRSPVGPPERRRFGDLEVFTCGAWCQGPVLLQTLALLEGTDLKALGHNSADYVHHLAEALKLAFADREAYYGDPAMIEVPLATLISEEYAAERRKLIRPDQAWPEMPPPGRARQPSRPRLWRFPSARGRPQPRARHLLCLRRRPPRQSVLGDPERRFLRLAGGAGDRADPVEPRLAIAPRPAPSGRCRPRQTAAADPQPGLGDQGRRAFHAVRHPRRRCPDPGDAAGPVKPFCLWPGHADRRSRARALPATAIPPPSPPTTTTPAAWRSRPASPNRSSPSSPAAATRSSAGPTGSGPPVRSARSMSTKSAASSRPAPTRAAPPTPSAGNPAPLAPGNRPGALRSPNSREPGRSREFFRFGPSKPPNRAKYLYHHNHLQANSRRQPQPSPSVGRTLAAPGGVLGAHVTGTTTS